MNRREEVPELVILLLGKTGSGKSTLANLLSGMELKDVLNENLSANKFKVGTTLYSCTKDFDQENCYLGGDQNKPILIIDGPGFEDNGELTNAAIFAKLYKFIQKTKPPNLIIIYCLDGLSRPTANDFNGFHNFQSFFGKQAMKKNTYVLVTKLNKLKEVEIERRIFQRDLPPMIEEKFQDFDKNHIIIPANLDELIDSLKSINPRLLHKIAFKPIDVNSLEADNPQFHTVLNLMKEDVTEELKKLSPEECKKDEEKQNKKNHYQETLLSINIIQRKVYNDLSSILASLENSASHFHHVIHKYFTFDEDLENELTLINDIYKILTRLCNEDNEMRLKKDNYEKYLLDKFNKEIDKAIICSLDKIIQNAVSDAKNRKMAATGVLSTGLTFESQMTIKSFATSLVSGASTLSLVGRFLPSLGVSFGTGATVAGAGVANEATFFGATGTTGASAVATGTAASGIMLAGLGIGATLGLVGWGVWIISWKKSTCIQELSPKIHKSLLDKNNTEASNSLKRLVEVSCTYYLLSLLHLEYDS